MRGEMLQLFIECTKKCMRLRRIHLILPSRSGRRLSYLPYFRDLDRLLGYKLRRGSVSGLPLLPTYFCIIFHIIFDYLIITL